MQTQATARADAGNTKSRHRQQQEQTQTTARADTGIINSRYNRLLSADFSGGKFGPQQIQDTGELNQQIFRATANVVVGCGDTQRRKMGRSISLGRHQTLLW